MSEGKCIQGQLQAASEGSPFRKDSVAPLWCRIKERLVNKDFTVFKIKISAYKIKEAN